MQNNYFYCYSYDLASYIMSKGIRYVCIAKSTKTDKTFTLFEQSEELRRSIKEFNQ